jgi:hypothetical protein
MKLLIQLLTNKINPKTLLVIVLAFFSGSVSPDIINSLIDILMSSE